MVCPQQGGHAGLSVGGSSAKVSAVWDGCSTSDPTYKAAVAGAGGAYAQAGDTASIGSPGALFTKGASLATPYTESFGTSLGAFTAFSVDADTTDTWYRHASSSTAEVNAFGDSAPANDWLISQSFDLTQTSVEYLSFTTWTRYSDTGVTNPEVKLMYSTNYSGTGSPTAATWTELSYTPSADNSQLITPSGLIDLSGIIGCNVYFAFQYTSSGTASSSSSQWRVDDFNVTGYSGAVLSVAATSANKVEGDSGLTAFTFTVTRAGDTSGTSTADYAVSGAAVDAADFGGTLPTGSVSFAAGETSKLITINVSGDAAAESSEAFTLTLSNASVGSVIAQASASGTIQDDDAAATLISAVQGSGAASTLDGSIVTVEAIVTAIMPGLNGFYIQEEAADSDGNASTSEGVFVYGSAAGFAVGDLVRLTAEVDEFSGLTELKNITSSSIISSGNPLPTATVVTLPVANMTDWEALEGMLVNVQSGTGNLVITDNYNLGRYGQVTLTSDTLLQQFTETDAPSIAGYTAYQASVQKDQIIIDDNQTAQNPAVHPGRGGNDLSASNTLRAGDSISSVVGVVDQYVSGGELGYETTYRIQPTIEPVFTGSARPTAGDLPVAVTGAEIKVASVNVLNYFTTLGTSSFTNPNGTSHSGRGASDATEFTRQQDKLVANLLGLDADVVALMEIQNNGFGDETSAIDALVDALNDVAGAGTYAYVTGPYPDGTAPDAATAGDDAIMVAFLYKPSAVTVVGKAVADPSSYDAFSATYGNRVPVAVTFQSLTDGETFTAVANHFKSKGSVIDADIGDGQGANNLARMEAATDLLAWLGTNPTGTLDTDILLLGDFNAYSHEEPIAYIDANGYNKVSSGLSYSFDGLWGSLDHALASDSLTSQVTGAVKWAINAEEPGILDYNLEYKDAAQDISYYAADAYRSSDHNPVLIGLNLGGGAPDTTPPVFASASVNGTTLTMTYDSTLDATNLPATTDFVVTVGGAGRVINAVAVSGTTVTLTLAVAVLAGETVTVRYTDPSAANDTNAVQDLAGNDAATFSAVNATNNTPAPDITAPTLVSSTPADEATGVARSADIVLNFSENVQKGSGDILIKKVSDGSTYATIAVSDAQVSVSGAQVTINPTANLLASTDYYIEMAAGVLEDLAGNDYAGLSGAEALDFTTEATPVPALALIGMNTDANDSFAFLVLSDITAGTTFTFTDEGWLSTNAFRSTGEDELTWAPSVNIARGTVITWENTVGWSSSAGSPTTSGALSGLSASGEQILVFTGAAATPNFIYALNNEGAHVWQASATDTQTSALPLGLVNGYSAVALTELDNYIYTGSTNGTVDQLLAWIGDFNNWTGSDAARQDFSSMAFTII